MLDKNQWCSAFDFLSFFSNFRQVKVNVQVWLCVSDPRQHVIKSQSETVWSNLTRLPWESHISRITAQSVSLPSLIGHRDLLQRRGSFSFHIRPVLNGIDGSGSGQAQQRRGSCGWGGDGLELHPHRGAVEEKVSGNVLNHFCLDCLQFRNQSTLIISTNLLGKIFNYLLVQIANQPMTWQQSNTFSQTGFDLQVASWRSMPASEWGRKWSKMSDGSAPLRASQTTGIFTTWQSSTRKRPWRWSGSEVRIGGLVGDHGEATGSKINTDSSHSQQNMFELKAHLWGTLLGTC